MTTHANETETAAGIPVRQVSRAEMMAELEAAKSPATNSAMKCPVSVWLRSSNGAKCRKLPRYLNGVSLIAPWHPSPESGPKRMAVVRPLPANIGWSKNRFPASGSCGQFLPPVAELALKYTLLRSYEPVDKRSLAGY